MPDFDNESLEQFNVGNNFQYSAMNITDLGSSEYTLVSIVLDLSGSVSSYVGELEKAVVAVVESCKKSPRVDNLMLRVVTFNNKADEFHGFKLFQNCNPGDYKNVFRCTGMTALYDAVCNAVKSQNAYAKSLVNQDFNVNGIVFVITDGANNNSTATEAMVKAELDDSLKKEYMESMVSVLIGVDGDSHVKAFLQDFNKNVGFTQYVSMGEASANKLAKLADFVSKSISSQSSSLGTGGPSKQISVSF